MDKVSVSSWALPSLEEVGAAEWSRAAVCLARSLFSSRPDGLVGYLVSDEEYVTLTGGTSFQPASPSQPGTETYDKATDLRWQKEQEALSVLRRCVCASVPSEVLEGCPGYSATYGPLFLDLRTLFAFVLKREKLVSSQRYTDALKVLERAWLPGASFEKYVSAQAAAHRECERMGFSLNQEDKLRRLSEGVGGATGPFALVLELWEEQVAHVPEQRTFEDGVVVEDQPLLPTPPTSQADVKVKKAKVRDPAPLASSTVPAYEGLATRLKRAALRLAGPRLGTPSQAHPSNPFSPPSAAAVQGHGSAPLGGTPRAKGSATRGKGKQWCDNHGWVAHTTHECRGARKDTSSTRHTASARSGVGGEVRR